jgi:tetratricopeptide (TPR) repeat protein
MQHRFSQHLLQQGIAASKAGQVEDAARLLQKAVELDSDNELAWLWLSGVVDTMQERRYCLEQALRINPYNVPAGTGLKWLEQQSTGTSPSSSASTPVVSATAQPVPNHEPAVNCPFCKAPLSPQSTFCAHCQCALVVICPACGAQCAVEKRACASCGCAMGDHRQGATFFVNLAGAYLQNGQAGLALGACKSALKLDPTDGNAFLRLGQARLLTDTPESAQVSFRQALENAANPTTLIALGRALEERQQWEDAQQAYEKALEIDGEAAGTHFALGRALIEQKSYQAAFSSLRQATRLDPKHAGAWFLLGRLYEVADEPHKAIQAHETAVALSGRTSSQGEAWIKRASEHLNVLRPDLPESVALNWPETIRQTGALAIIPALAALVNAGLRPWHISPPDYLGVLLGILGAYLWVSASGLPLNPGMRAMLGPDGLAQSRLRTAVGMLGGAFWAMALLYLLLAPALTSSAARG